MQEKVILDQITVEDLTCRLVRAVKDGIPSTTFPEPEEYLTRQQTAKLIQISLVTLRDWTVKGILQSYRIGSRVRYKRTEIEQALKATKNLKYRRDK